MFKEYAFGFDLALSCVSPVTCQQSQPQSYALLDMRMGCHAETPLRETSKCMR